MIGGLLVGVFGAVLVRIGVALLVGGVRVLAVLVLAGVAWLALGRMGKGRRGH